MKPFTIVLLLAAAFFGARSLISSAGVLASNPAGDESPTAGAHGPDVNLDGPPHPPVYTFTVTYRDDTGIDLSTLGTGDLQIRPGARVPTFVSVESNTNATRVTATYQFTWGATPAERTYDFLMNSMEVADISGNFVTQFEIGSFEVGSFGTPTPTQTPPPGPACLVTEQFDSVTDLGSNGWSLINHSTVVGSQPTWFQGNMNIFSAASGSFDQYAAANFESTAGKGTISNWMITPVVTIRSGTRLIFYTRTVTTPQFPDRLQVRMSTNGDSSNIGQTPTDVGDFTTLLLDIDPEYAVTGYYNKWTQYIVLLGGSTEPQTGRLAFRYFTENGGPDGPNSHYIGIDTFVYDTCETPTPTPTPTATPTNTPTGSPTATPTATATPVPHWDLRIAQSAPTSVNVGSPLIYTVRVTNFPASFGMCLNNIEAKFKFPTGVPLIFNAASGTKDFVPHLSAEGVNYTGGILCSHGTLPPENGAETAELTIIVTPLAAGTLTSFGSDVIVDPNHRWGDNNPGNNMAQTIHTIVNPKAADLFDYDGDGRSDISVFRPSSGTWYLQRSAEGFYGQNFGLAGDRIAPADYDGDGRTDIAVFRASTGIWYVAHSADGTVSNHVFGVAEDVPTPADYDGDGKADISVFRPSTGTWYRLNSGNGSFIAEQFGVDGDRPTVGDFDGDGKADLAVFRPSTAVWYHALSSNGSFFAEHFGVASDRPVPADYDGDGSTDIAIYRPADGLWYIRNSSTVTYTPYLFGLAADIPVPADFDGDGKADIGVFRPSDGTWYIANSTNSRYTTFQFGLNGDLPTQSAFGE